MTDTILTTPVAQTTTPPSESNGPAESSATDTLPPRVEETSQQGTAPAQTDENAQQPIAYTDFTLPQDFQADSALLQELKDVAASHRLPQAEVQKLVDMGMKLVQKTQQNHVQAWEKIYSDWAQALPNDSEYGGPEFASNMALAREMFDTDKMRKQFGVELVPPGLKKLLDPPSPDNPDGLGLGNHPDIVRFFFRLSKLRADDKVLVGHSGRESAALSTLEYYKRMFKDK